MLPTIQMARPSASKMTIVLWLIVVPPIVLLFQSFSCSNRRCTKRYIPSHRCTMWYMRRQPEKRPDHGKLLDRCLRAFIRAGTLDLSLDQLAREVGVSKRMLIHYFGGRDSIEERAMELLENRLRAQFAPNNLPSGISLQQVLSELWTRTTDPASKGVLLLI